MKTVKRYIQSNWNVICIGLYVALLVIAPLLSTKIVTIFGLSFAAGVIPALFAYQLLDVFNELIGPGSAKQVVWAGLGVKVLIFGIVIPLTMVLPGMPLASIFETSLRLFVATEVMNLGMNLLVDIPIFNWFKKFKLGFFARSNLSNILSWTVGAVIFVVLGYAGTPAFTMGLIVGQILIRYPLTLLYTTITAGIVKGVA